jgi:hypothetical protein
MALTPRAFSGASFFSSIRTQMNSNRGFFGGVDGDFKYVCVDASFYRLMILMRPPALTFTEAALAMAPQVRAIGNGQMFNGPYCWTHPCVVTWQGRIISGGTTTPGGTAAAAFRHFGQWTGASELSFALTAGDPTTITPTYFSAIGRLLPLVTGGVGSPAGPLGNYWSEPASTGKIVYGIARAGQVLFMLVQENGGDGLNVPALITRLTSMHVDDALLGDGSNSVTLVVDGAVEVSPSFYKNNSIPVGPMFRIHALQLAGLRSMTNTPATTDPQLQMAISLADTAATLRLTSPGMQLTIASLGTPTGIALATLISRLGITLPLNLTTPTSLISSAATFTAPNITATLTLTSTNTFDGHITGTLTFTTSRGIVQFNVDWQVMDGP